MNLAEYNERKKARRQARAAQNRRKSALAALELKALQEVRRVMDKLDEIGKGQHDRVRRAKLRAKRKKRRR